jgi:large subunit ribosomal protein L10
MFCGLFLQLQYNPDAAPILTSDNIQLALQRAPRSRNDNMVSTTKVYFYEIYRQILSSNRAIFVIQNNNLTAHEYKQMKLDIKKAGFTVTAVRNSVFCAAVNDFANENKLKGIKRLKELFVGPSVVVFSNASDDEKPMIVADFFKAMEKHGKKTLVVGGRLDGVVLSCDQLKEVVKLPPLSMLRSELLGVLSQPAAMVKGVLEQNQKALMLALMSHEKSLEEGASGETKA